MELLDYLKYAVEAEASDLFIVAGGPVCVKLDKRMTPVNSERVFPQETERLIMGLYELANRPPERYLDRGDDDFSFSVGGLARFRVNTYRQRGSLAAVVRVVAFDIPDWEKLSIPPQVMDLAEETHGMILVTGTAGSGNYRQGGNRGGSSNYNRGSSSTRGSSTGSGSTSTYRGSSSGNRQNNNSSYRQNSSSNNRNGSSSSYRQNNSSSNSSYRSGGSSSRSSLSWGGGGASRSSGSSGGGSYRSGGGGGSRR